MAKRKRNKISSPLRVAKMSRGPDGKLVIQLHDSIDLSSKPMPSKNDENYQNDFEDITSDENLESKESSDSDIDGNEILEKIINDRQDEEEESFYGEDEEKLTDNDLDSKFKVLGGKEDGLWAPSDKSWDFFLEAADIELKPELVTEIKDKFNGSEELNSHLQPPKFDKVLWSTVKKSLDGSKLKQIFHAQSLQYLAIKPLLDSLSKTKSPEMQENLITSIQLMCSSNLQLNRLRRNMTAFHLKPEYGRSLVNTKVTHNSLIGEEPDFLKTAESLVKEQTVVDKIIKKKSVQNRLNFYGPSTSQTGQRFFREDRAGFRGGTRGGARGNGRGYKPRGGRSRGNFSLRGRGKGPKSSED